MFKPDADTLFSFGGAQPFVPLYAVILGKGGHIFMNIVNISSLWFVSAFKILRHSRLLLNKAHKNVEHGNRCARSIAACLCRRPRRSATIFWLGIKSGRWAAEECSDSCLGRCSHHHLHHPPFQCRLHIPSFCGWCSISGSLWAHLLWSSVSYARQIPRAKVESWKMEPAIPDCWHILERLGGRGAVFAIRISCYRINIEL